MEETSLQRPHLPFRGEKEQSLRIIATLEDELAQLDKKRKAVNDKWDQGYQESRDAFRAKQTEIKARYEEAMKVASAQLAVEREDADENRKRQLKILDASRNQVETRLRQEKAAISNYRKMPEEILVEILKWAVGDWFPSSRFALVCKEWKRLLLTTPSLWINIAVRYMPETLRDSEAQRLKRRLDLSRSALLSVTLNGYRSYMSNCDDQFHLIATTKKERWQKLHINTFGGPQVTKEWSHLLDGNFSNLRVLHMNNVGLEYPIFDPAMKAIASSRPTLLEVSFGQGVELPDALRDTCIFQNVTTLQVAANSLAGMSPLNSLQELRVHGKATAIDLHRYPVLPPFTEFQHLARLHLAALQLSTVKNLSIGRWDGEGSPVAIIELPNLTHLDISDGELVNLQHLTAPRLEYFKFGNHDRRREQPQYLTQAEWDLVLLRPTTLEIHIPIYPDVLVMILDNWPQLQVVTIPVQRIGWKALFTHGLTKKKSLLCPNLVHLRLALERKRGKTQAETLKKLVDNVFEARKAGSLKSVKWRRRDGYATVWRSMSDLDTGDW